MAAPAPRPRVLYIHDDLSEQLSAHGKGSPVHRLGDELFALLRRQPTRVVLLTLAQQLEALIARREYAPFPIAVGIGEAGARVATQVHRRIGWFPSIRRVDVWREEDDDGGYALAASAPLASQLADLPGNAPLAIVDDTIFSGLTMKSVLAALSPGARANVHVFCLRAVAESVADIARSTPVMVGFAAPGRILEDVSFINASGLVRRGAIRRAGRASLAFFERPEWMEAWFPGYHGEVIALCRELTRLV